MVSGAEMTELNGILECLSTTEPAQVLDRAAEIRKRRRCLFLELPPELRNTVYRMLITPVSIEMHVRFGKNPILLSINRQIAQGFYSIYYSKESFTVQLYHGSHDGWKFTTDRRIVQTIVNQWQLCGITNDPKPIDTLKSKIESRPWPTSCWCRQDDCKHIKNVLSLEGALHFRGIPNNMGLHCTYYVNAIGERSPPRASRWMRRDHAKKSLWVSKY